MRASLLATLAYNQGHSEGPFRLFEVGRVFSPRVGDLPDEQEVTAGVMSGLRSEPSWLVDDGFLDYFDTKGMLTSALDRLGIAASYESTGDPSCQPGRCARIIAGNEQLGILGELQPTIREGFDLRPQPVTFFELYLNPLLKAQPGGERIFKSLSRYPAATRDLALVVATDVPAGKVQEIIRRHRLVERIELFDVYTGANIPSGTKSLAFHIYLQSSERTLTAEEVNRSLRGLLRTLEREVGASLRT